MFYKRKGPNTNPRPTTDSVFAWGSMKCYCSSDFAAELDVSLSTFFNCILCELYLISGCKEFWTQTAVCLLSTPFASEPIDVETMIKGDFPGSALKCSSHFLVGLQHGVEVANELDLDMWREEPLECMYWEFMFCLYAFTWVVTGNTYYQVWSLSCEKF